MPVASVPGELLFSGAVLLSVAPSEFSELGVSELVLLPMAVLVAAAMAAINKNTPAAMRTVRLLINGVRCETTPNK